MALVVENRRPVRHVKAVFEGRRASPSSIWQLVVGQMGSLVRDRRELVVCHETLGEFPVDDNEGLVDSALTPFIFEVRDVTIPPIERRYLPQ